MLVLAFEVIHHTHSIFTALFFQFLKHYALWDVPEGNTMYVVTSTLAATGTIRSVCVMQKIHIRCAS